MIQKPYVGKKNRCMWQKNSQKKCRWDQQEMRKRGRKKGDGGVVPSAPKAVVAGS